MKKNRFLFPLAIGILFCPALWGAEPKMIQAGGAELYFLEAGSGRPIVMIHGNHSSLEVYAFSIFDRVSQKHRAVALDLPGFGLSSRPKKKMTFDDHARILHEALHKLKIEQPVLVGHSMGSAIVLRYLLNYPGEAHAAVLISPYTKPFRRIRKIYRIARIPGVGDLFIWSCIKPIQFFRRTGAWTRIGFSPAPVDMAYSKKEVRLALKRRNFKNAARTIYALRDALSEMNGRYGEIHIPVLILAGDSDLIAPAAEQAQPLHEKIPGSRLILLPQTGHLPMFTRAEEILKAIEAAAQEKIALNF